MIRNISNEKRIATAGFARKIGLKTNKNKSCTKNAEQPTPLDCPKERGFNHPPDHILQQRNLRREVWHDPTHPHLPRRDHQVAGDQLAEKVVDMPL